MYFLVTPCRGVTANSFYFSFSLVSFLFFLHFLFLFFFFSSLFSIFWAYVCKYVEVMRNVIRTCFNYWICSVDSVYNNFNNRSFNCDTEICSFEILVREKLFLFFRYLLLYLLLYARSMIMQLNNYRKIYFYLKHEI